MRPLSLVGTSLLFAGCMSEPPAVAAGEACDEDGATSCAADSADDAGYICVDGAWTSDPDCECDRFEDAVVCVDTAIGFTGVARAGARPAKGRRLRRA